MNLAPGLKPVPTRAALALQKNNQTSDFQALVFEDPIKPSRANEHNTAIDNSRNLVKRSTLNNEQEEFDIKKARHEVLRFAINNQRATKNKEKMQAFQLVKMGAKPPKKAYKNYKELLGERKRLKQIREERKKLHQLGKNQTGIASVKCRSKTKLEKQLKKRAPVTAIDQNYGTVRPKSNKRK